MALLIGIHRRKVSNILDQMHSTLCTIFCDAGRHDANQFPIVSCSAWNEFSAIGAKGTGVILRSGLAPLSVHRI